MCFRSRAFFSLLLCHAVSAISKYQGADIATQMMKNMQKKSCSKTTVQTQKYIHTIHLSATKYAADNLGVRITITVYINSAMLLCNCVH